jgi:OTU domain-containing protein 5
LAEKNLMTEAIKKSEDFQIEQAMLDDKLKATDWEATNDEIMELVAQESYLQWLKDNEKRHTLNPITEAVATCSSWGSDTTQSFFNQKQSSPDKHGGGKGASKLSHHHQHHHLKQQQAGSPKQTKKSPTIAGSFGPTNGGTTTAMTSQTANMEPAATPFEYYETKSIMSQLPPDLFGLNANEWTTLAAGAADPLDTQLTSDNDILAQVLAASQQEYLDGLKAKRHQHQHQPR